MLFVLSLLGCAPDVISLYAKERETALTYLTDHPTDWQPDVALRLSPDAIAQAVRGGLRAALAKDPDPIGIDLPLGQRAQMIPHLVVDQAKVVPTDRCSPCVEFDGNLLGKVRWSVLSLEGGFPFEVSASGILEVNLVDGAKVEARLQQVRSLNVKVMDLGRFSVNPSTTLQRALQAVLLQRLKPMLLTTLDTSTLPVREVRLSTSNAGLKVEMLTNTPAGKALPPLAAATSDVELAMSEATLIGLARRAAFTQGTLSMDVAADPRILMVNGDSFTMGLRLWRLVGRGWWRDYTVNGKIIVKDGDVKLKPTNASPGATSPGAGLVDPLALLFEGTILSTVEKGLRQTLPATHTERLGGGVRLASEVTSVEGRDGAVIVHGIISVLDGDSAVQTP